MSEITLKPKRFNQIEQEQSSFLITNNREIKDGEVISLVLEGTTTLLKRKVMAVLSDEGLKDGYKLLLVERLKRFVAL
jgi:hypothetical protein